MHVLIDLVGYTGGGERANEIFASRPAALQAIRVAHGILLQLLTAYVLTSFIIMSNKGITACALRVSRLRCGLLPLKYPTFCFWNCHFLANGTVGALTRLESAGRTSE